MHSGRSRSAVIFASAAGGLGLFYFLLNFSRYLYCRRQYTDTSDSLYERYADIIGTYGPISLTYLLIIAAAVLILCACRAYTKNKDTTDKVLVSLAAFLLSLASFWGIWHNKDMNAFYWVSRIMPAVILIMFIFLVPVKNIRNARWILLIPFLLLFSYALYTMIDNIRELTEQFEKNTHENRSYYIAETTNREIAYSVYNMLTTVLICAAQYLALICVCGDPAAHASDPQAENTERQLDLIRNDYMNGTLSDAEYTERRDSLLSCREATDSTAAARETFDNIQ